VDPNELSRRPHIPLPAQVLGLRGPRTHDCELIGTLPGRPRLAIVGSRAAHRRVLRMIPAIVEVAGMRGYSIVSGGALGIDGAAHRAALDLGVPQLAVLPCGRDRLYPPGHARMFAAMIESGDAGLLFAHPFGTETVREMFASRNEIVVALADVLIVAEAGLRSGSRGTGALALNRGLPVAALAGSPGCGALIGAGARAIAAPLDDPDTREQITTAIASWLDELAGAPPSNPSSAAWPEHLTWLARLLSAAGPAGASFDALDDPDAASVALLEAELLGLVCEAGPGRWVAVA
jgi:DNA protecting protein DprA